MAWGGLYISDFDVGGGVNTSGKSSVSLAVNTGSNGGEDVYLSLYGTDTSQTIGTVRISDYLVSPSTGQKYPVNTPLAPNTWYYAIVPLSALNAVGVQVTRIGLESDRIGSVWFDDIAITSPIVLKWPLGGVPRTVSGYRFGDNWEVPGTQCPSGIWKLHTGVDYSASVGNNVYAAETGVVKHVEKHIDAFGNNWGYHVVLEHITSSGQKYTTVCWHITPVAGLDSFIGPIAKGQKIGTVASISAGTHLHFGVWIGNYATYGENGPAVGSLPANACAQWPGFPAGFIDPNDARNVLFQ